MLNINGEVSLEQKRADVIPLHKGEFKDEPLNYRHISLTKVMCKMEMDRLCLSGPQKGHW